MSFLVVFFFFTSIAIAQTATIKGTVKNEEGKPIEDVSVTYNQKGTTTDSNGRYTLSLPANTEVTVIFSHIAYTTLNKKVKIPKNRNLFFSPKLKIKIEEIETVVVKDKKDDAQGIDKVPIETIKKLPSANAGIEGTLKNIGLGVSGNNELSTQYNVRGGNYDENLVYVNGIEVYRPFLVRSGQQEGLSFVNPNLTQNVKFSAGGFQAKYGDKLSSVLDITYKKPKSFGIGLEASLLGGSLTAEGISKDKKLSAILGARYRNNSLFVNQKDIETNFKPSFTDVQTYVSYQFNNKFSLDFLGNFSLNNYKYTPVSRETKFGTISDPKALIVNYRGKETDQYLTLFGALKGTYLVNDNLKLELTSSAYNTQEEEHYDILAFYGIGTVNADFGSDSFGDVEFSQAIGSQLDHARNDLDALITNIQVKATLKKDKHLFEFGAKYQLEDIKDRIVEWEVIDSAGFSLRPPNLLPSNDEPYNSYTGPIVPFTSVRATNNVQINRISGFGQWSKSTYLNDTQLWFNLGVRAQNWKIKAEGTEEKGHTVISPRAQFAIKPDWKKDMLFRVSGGYYYQPPFYRELRDSSGMVHPEVKAQRSIHFVLGNDYSFKLWNRPFKLVTEAYFKSLTDVNPFTVDNVQIRYRAINNAKAYAVGFDARINGEFVEGTESYFSFGYLKTEENIDNQGYIARPTDQRLKFAVLFQDYVPNYPNLKMYLNMVYNTGLPGGSPSYADPYIFQSRLKDYFRSDIGMSYVFKDAENTTNIKWLENFKEFSLGIELFNMFDVQNSITNTWVRDISSSRSIGIPNYLSGRVLNLKLKIGL
ncbi:carboxypeptidase-like regulatory domain-containing protein [Aureibaculum sp. A20]|uniref:Carboxypeptidase-like regulatory domain-containing protein n=1 Tax=Aureibaculum flavum TaxID=2795986 RepID=A0ABS0WU09_9FLAO|nr:carboxypeptidase-like regulatory domain-containing protein [Aureibaculum flavum]